jgi:hypothetical protein
MSTLIYYFLIGVELLVIHLFFVLLVGNSVPP